MREIAFRLEFDSEEGLGQNSKTPGVPYEFCVISVDERQMRLAPSLNKLFPVGLLNEWVETNASHTVFHKR